MWMFLIYSLLYTTMGLVVTVALLQSTNTTIPHLTVMIVLQLVGIVVMWPLVILFVLVYKLFD